MMPANNLVLPPPINDVYGGVTGVPGMAAKAAKPAAVVTPDTLWPFHGDGFDPLTLMLAGRRGMGKTATLTFIAGFFEAHYKAQNRDVKIASNFNCDYASDGWSDPMIVDYINGFPPDARDMLVLVDEAAAYFPRRRSLARTNVDFSTFLQQIRKRGIEMAFTTQFPGMLDDQMLINIDLYSLVSMWPRSGPSKGRYVDIYVWDWHGQFTGQFTRPRIPPDGPPTWRRRFHNVNRAAFGHYNTYEVIGAIWSHNRDSIAAQYWDVVEPDGTESTAPEPVIVPATLLDFLLSLGNSFIVGRFVADAGGFDATVHTIGDFKQRINDLGYHDIVRDGGMELAVLKQP